MTTAAASVPVFALLGLTVACGGTQKKAAATPFTPEDGVLFDQSLDTVEDPPVSTEGTGLVGEFERRVIRSDFITVVELTSLHTGSGTDRRVAYRLVGNTSEAIKGRPPREVTLRVEEVARGFRTIRQAEDQLMERPYILYAKWQQNVETGELRLRWHLSLDTPQVREKARTALRRNTNAPDLAVEVLSD